MTNQEIRVLGFLVMLVIWIITAFGVIVAASLSPVSVAFIVSFGFPYGTIASLLFRDKSGLGFFEDLDLS